MKKPAVLCILLLTAGLLFGQESISIDFLTSLNAAISEFDFSNTNNSGNGFLVLPSVFINRRHQIYAGFGFMLTLEDQKKENFADNEENMPNTLLNAAFTLRYKKTNITLFLEYRRDDSWGLSVKLRF